MQTGHGNPLLPRLKADHKFRLGIPSYVLPADILPNVEALAPFVDDIELAMFESDLAAFPAPEIINQLARIAEKNELSYTVHLPLDRKLGSASRKECAHLQKAMLAVIRLMRPLRPLAWILHLEGLPSNPGTAEIKAWQHRLAGLMPPIVAAVGDPRFICVENLLYPFDWCGELIEAFKLGVCIDIGHLLATGANLSTHLQQFLPRTRVIHLHGVRGGKPHQALDAIPGNDLRELLANLAGFKGVLTLEIFNLPDLSASIKLLGQCLKRR